MIFTVNIILLVALAFMGALTALMALVLIVQPWVSTSSLTTAIYPEFASTLRPEAETLYYRFFVVVALLLGWGLIYLCRNNLSSSDLTTALRPRVKALGIGVALALMAAFQIIVYQPRHQLAHAVLIIVLIATLLVQIFLPEILQLRQRIRLNSTIMFYVSMVMIGTILWIPNSQAAVARFFFGEQFHHNDSFIMGAILTINSGLIPNWDIISQYGFGIGYVMTALTNMLGGISYEHVLTVMVLLTIIYYNAWFCLLKAWFGRLSLALAVVLLAIKWQMFHPGVYPFVFTYGSTTPVRFMWDVIFFALLFWFIMRRYPILFWLAALIPGIQLWYLHSEGVYLLLAWYAFIILETLLRMIHPQQRRVILIASGLAAAVVPLLTGFILLVLTAGQCTFKPEFWAHVREFSQYFFSGFGVEPMTYNLINREFGALVMGFCLPLSYVATLIAAFKGYQRLGRQSLLMVPIAVYGLGLYHYYVTRSTLTSFDVGSLTLAVLLGCWINVWIEQTKHAAIKRYLPRWVLGFVIVFLGTTHMYVMYPNVLNVSRHPYTDPWVAKPLTGGKPYLGHLFRETPDGFKFNVNNLLEPPPPLVSEFDLKDDEDLIRYYRQESDFTNDVNLIKRLTPEGARVPLIASFEIKLLLDSQRKPYFYFFPLVISRPMTFPSLAKISIYTLPQMQRVINALEKDKPPYIFMERIFAARPLPSYFYQEYASMLMLTDYVLKHYQQDQTGQYLVAMKRKANE